MQTDSQKPETVAEAKSEATLAAPSGSATPPDDNYNKRLGPPGEPMSGFNAYLERRCNETQTCFGVTGPAIDL